MTGGLDPVFVVLARLSIALLFVGAARHKLADSLRFEGVVADYRLAPARWSFGIARGLVVLEVALVLAFALGFFIPVLASVAALAAAVVLAGYALAIGVNLARGRNEIECGCGGPGELLRPRLLLRNAVLIGVCLVGAAPSSDRLLGALDFVTVGAGLLILALLWEAGGKLAQVADGVAGEGVA